MSGRLHTTTTGSAEPSAGSAPSRFAAACGGQSAMTPADLLGERARITPDKTALIYVPDGRRYTYAEMNTGSCVIAQKLQQLGLKKGDRFCILSEPRPEYVQAFFATGKTGMVCVPLNSRNTARELTEIVRDCA